MKSVRSRIYLKLSVLIFALLLLVGVVQSVRVSQFWQAARAESQQIFYWSLAEKLARDLRGFETDGLDVLALDSSFRSLKELFPSFDFYILSASGRIIAHSGSKAINEPQVDVEPLERALSDHAGRLVPITAKDPRQPLRPVIFSVARIEAFNSDAAYLYVTLDSETSYSLAKDLQGFYALRGSMVDLLLVGLIVTAFGVFCFFLLTRRFRELLKVVRSFREGDYSRRLNVGGSDEVAELAATLNEMADRIDETVRKLEQTDRQRRDLVAAISHDLRTPLTAAMAQLELCDSKIDNLSPAARRLLVNVKVGLDSLEERISDLFELAKLEARERPVELKPFNVARLLHKIFILFEAEALEKDLEITNETPADLPEVSGDQALLERAISNLVKNAIRYTESGGVTLSALREGDEIVIAVSDSGIGISAEHQAAIFEPFFCANPARGGGTGLGLTIVERIISQHGSRIRVESRQGVGSKFSFRLPVYKHAEIGDDQPAAQ